MVNKRRMVSHVPRTLDLLAHLGFELHEKVERWTAFLGKDGQSRGGTRQDLFGVADVIAASTAPARILLAQVCSAGGLSARKKKIQAREELRLWLLSGGLFWIVAWRKVKNRWQPRILAAHVEHDGNIAWDVPRRDT